MSLIEDFRTAVTEKYPDFSITAVGSTWHTNVLLLTKDDTKYVAKSVWFDSDNASNEDRAQKAFETEVAILQRLPADWSIKYIDSFVSPSRQNRIIVTTQFINCPWSELKPKNYERVARSITRQINWLHANNISHGDLELKNILLACDQRDAVIIDFEKSKQDATTDDKARDKRRFLEAVKEKTPDFYSTMASVLSGRRASIGGTRRIRRNLRKNTKSRKNTGKKH
jgi:serine/threonine protein kinase